ncbi:acyl carrier protein [Streptomyces sp. TG1A-8]|uniref:acyl carrier protein n=1 Tax=Streptomyces sp. TG1A-8 TaxID=3051385 RepID=UPI00265C2C22|nr:acyl carrier protein [Streptomyces sp. TG1A-8]MDO0926661.1 acyl carrier protein [Streptomyces sp. TG1A-8]
MGHERRERAVVDIEGTGWEERRLREWLTGRLAARLGLAAEEARGIGPGTSFEQCGLDAVGALALAVDAESACGVLLEPTVAWDHPTVGSLARHLAREAERSRTARGEPAW